MTPATVSAAPELGLVPGWAWSADVCQLERWFALPTVDAQLRFLLDAAGEAQEAGLTFRVRPLDAGVVVRLLAPTDEERARVLRFARSFEMLLLIGSERCAP